MRFEFFYGFFPGGLIVPSDKYVVGDGVVGGWVAVVEIVADHILPLFLCAALYLRSSKQSPRLVLGVGLS